AIVSDDKEGSVLFYNFYSSNIANPAAENTRIDLTNTAQGTVFVHLFFVDGSSCAIADSFVCLSGNQTTTLLASDMDPGVRGYVVAVAVDPNGCPIRWNFLIGDEYVKLASGQQANLGAEAFAAISPDPTGCTQATSEATLRFDGVSYNLAPRVLALDNFASNLDGNQTLLVINRVGGDLSSTAATIGGLFGILFDDLEKPFSFQFSAGCQFFGMLSGSFPRTTPRVDTVISAGRSGWLKFWATADEGLLGAALVFNRGAGTTSSAYNQGHNLHKLRLTAAAQLTMPVFPPGVP
ncbi:MAG TPA: hypothetical protein VFD58_28625, partial [Blastocatellia bacterium]|nr:hypothetical protein [Blastocatellia bacterium]